MPYDEVMGKYRRGELHSGSDKGPVVKDRKQAVAIMLSEKRKAAEGKEEYKPMKKYDDGGDVTLAKSQGKPTPLPPVRNRSLPDTPKPSMPKEPLIPYSMPKEPPMPYGQEPPMPYGQELPRRPPLVIPAMPGKGNIKRDGKDYLILPDEGVREGEKSGESDIDYGYTKPIIPPPHGYTPRPPSPPPPHGGATGEWKKGGRVGKYAEGGDVNVPRITVGGDIKNRPITPLSPSEDAAKVKSGELPPRNIHPPKLKKPETYMTTEGRTSLRKGELPTRPDQLVSGDISVRARDFKRSEELYGPGSVTVLPGGRPVDYGRQTIGRAIGYDVPAGDTIGASGKTEYKKGGKVGKYAEGGDVAKSPPPIPPPPPPPREPKANRGKIDTLSAAPDTKVEVLPMVQARKGGNIGKYSGGGEVCVSNKKQIKQNLAETTVNPTGKMGFEKGGEVGWKKPSWRRW